MSLADGADTVSAGLVFSDLAVSGAISAVISAVTASVLAWWFNHRLELSRRRALLIDRVCDDLRVLGEAAICYWERADSPDDESLQRESAAMKAHLHRLAKTIGLLHTHKALANHGRINGYMLDIRKTATGGDFDVRGRDAEPERGFKCQRRCGDLVVLLYDETFR